MTCRQAAAQAAATTAATLLLCCLLCAATLYATGDRIDCRYGDGSGFCALRTRYGSGVSVQVSLRPGLSLWRWGPRGRGDERVWGWPE